MTAVVVAGVPHYKSTPHVTLLVLTHHCTMLLQTTRNTSAPKVHVCTPLAALVKGLIEVGGPVRITAEP